MKILSNYDRYVTEILAVQVRARLTFKVCLLPLYLGLRGNVVDSCLFFFLDRAISIHTVSAMKYGLS
jgi:hypothetical protein